MFFVTAFIVLNSFLLNLKMAWLLVTSCSVISKFWTKSFSFGTLALCDPVISLYVQRTLQLLKSLAMHS